MQLLGLLVPLLYPWDSYCRINVKKDWKQHSILCTFKFMRVVEKKPIMVYTLSFLLALFIVLSCGSY
jgi:hypothetical protein